jgi:hypothetical protein
MVKDDAEPMDLVKEIRSAFESEDAGLRFIDGATPVDRLIASINSQQDNKSQWAHALWQFVRNLDPKKNDPVWPHIEALTIQGDLGSAELVKELEEIVAEQKHCGSSTNIAIYSLLSTLGRPPSATTVQSDQDLQENEPLRWLDLLLKLLPTRAEKRLAVIRLIHAKKLTVGHIAQRLNVMRDVGQPSLSDWIDAMKSALPSYAAYEFDTLIADAFGGIDKKQNIKDTLFNQDFSKVSDSLNLEIATDFLQHTVPFLDARFHTFDPYNYTYDKKSLPLSKSYINRWESFIDTSDEDGFLVFSMSLTKSSFTPFGPNRVKGPFKMQTDRTAKHKLSTFPGKLDELSRH